MADERTKAAAIIKSMSAKEAAGLVWHWKAAQSTGGPEAWFYGLDGAQHRALWMRLKLFEEKRGRGFLEPAQHRFTPLGRAVAHQLAGEKRDET